MEESILNTIKKLLGIPATDMAFDLDILVFINDAIAKLHQVGVGPDTPVIVEDNTTLWSAITTDVSIQSMAKTFVHISTKLAFDPPGNSFITDSFKRMLDELIWRINEEANPYVPPVIP